MKSRNKIIVFSLTLLLIIAALFLWIFTVGHETIALILGGVGIILLIFTFLRILEVKGKKAAVYLRWFFVGLLVLGCAVFAFLESIVINGANTSEEAEAPYLIVLGAKVNGREPSLILSERLRAAYEYMEEHPDAIAVLSGGQGRGESISEAQAMENWLIEHGIDPNRLIKEEFSTNTWENITNSMDIIRDTGESGEIRAAIVTSDFHMYRAVYIAERAGIDAVSAPAETVRFDLKLNYYIREAAALVKLYLA